MPGLLKGGEMKEILRSLRHNFYLYYRAFGPEDKNTQHAYEEWKDTLIGYLEEGKVT